MPSFPIYIQGYGTANFNSGAERDVYQTFVDLFTPVLGVYPHTTMDSEVRLTKNNPLLNAVIDDIGLPRLQILPISIPVWNATYPQGVSPVIDMEDKFVDRISPHFDKETYYQNNLPACGDPCEIIYIRGNKVYMLVTYAAMKVIEAKVADYTVNEEDPELMQSYLGSLQVLRAQYYGEFGSQQQPQGGASEG